MSEPQLVKQGEGLFAVNGELDKFSVPAFWRATSGFLDGGDVTVDLNGVRRCDSAGLALLIQWMREARSQSVDIRFTNLPDQLVHIAEASGLEEILALSRV